jgi:hypothetical protein
MLFLKIRRAAILAIFSSIPLAGASPALAEDFRFVSRVYEEGKVVPIQTSTTLFKAGFAYNYVEEDPETTLLDRAAERIVVLHTGLKIRSEITFQQLDESTAKLRGALARNKNAESQFLSKPVFAETYDEKEGKLRLVSVWLTYDARVEPMADKNSLDAYRNFADAQSKFNMIVNPTAIPYPLCRLALNEALHKHGVIPIAVKRDLPKGQKKGTGPASLRAEHETLSRLTDADLARIAETDRQLVQFEKVEIDKYRRK